MSKSDIIFYRGGKVEQKELLEKINENTSLDEIQSYIKEVVALRGFTNQSIQETMLLLLEETGELAKAIRKSETKMSVDVDKLQNYDTVESEVADVFFVLAAICNQLDVDLLKALKEKERKNFERSWSFER